MVRVIDKLHLAFCCTIYIIGRKARETTHSREAIFDIFEESNDLFYVNVCQPIKTLKLSRYRLSFSFIFIIIIQMT